MFRVLLVCVAMAAGGIAAWLALASPPSASLAVREPAKPAVADILVAAENIPQGQKINPKRVKWQPWPVSALRPEFITRKDRPDAIKELTGAVLRTAVFAGELIIPEKIVQSDTGYLSVVLAPGKRAVAVKVTQVSSAGGFILPNDRVDVLQTVGCAQGSDGCLNGKKVNTILENVRVLAVDQRSGDAEGNAVVGKTATVELEPWQAEKIVSAQASGLLTLVLRPASESDAPTTEKPQKVVRATKPKTYTVRIRRAGVPEETVTFK